jgi:hypothetical protein
MLDDPGKEVDRSFLHFSFCAALPFFPSFSPAFESRLSDDMHLRYVAEGLTNANFDQLLGLRTSRLSSVTSLRVCLTAIHFENR